MSVPSLTPKDVKDLKFGVEHGVDWIALSFVREAKDITKLRARIKKIRTSLKKLPTSIPPKIIAKIEKHEAVDNIDEQARLQNLGVQLLDDTESASIPALIRALTIIGDRLSTEWGREEILKSPGRWRLVRGAIQEIYRRLNHYQGVLDCPPDTKFATRSPEGVQFRTTAMYYADPGSAVERAFMGMLPLFDADRPYPQLFEQMILFSL